MMANLVKKNPRYDHRSQNRDPESPVRPVGSYSIDIELYLSWILSRGSLIEAEKFCLLDLSSPRLHLLCLFTAAQTRDIPKEYSAQPRQMLSWYFRQSCLDSSTKHSRRRLIRKKLLNLNRQF